MPTRPERPGSGGNEDRTPSRKRRGQTAANRSGSGEEEDDAFDLWLRQSLHDAFDSVAAEPIPEDILSLIEEDRAERERIRFRRKAKQEG